MAEKDVFKKVARTKVPVGKELLRQLESMPTSKAAEILELLEEVGLSLDNLTLDDSLETEYIDEDMRIDIMQTNRYPDSFAVLVSKLDEEWMELERYNGFDSIEEVKVKFEEVRQTF